MAVLLARLHLHPLKFWFKGTFKSSVNLFRSLKFTHKAREPCFGRTHSCLSQKQYIDPSLGKCHNRCLERGLWKAHEPAVPERQMVRKDGYGDPRKCPRARDSLESKFTVQRGCERKTSFLPDRHHDSSSLAAEEGWQPVQENEWYCKRNLAQMPQRWSNDLSEIPLRGDKSQNRCPVQRYESPGVE